MKVNSETFVGMSESNAATIRMNGFTYMLASTALLAIIVFGNSSDLIDAAGSFLSLLHI